LNLKVHEELNICLLFGCEINGYRCSNSLIYRCGTRQVIIPVFRYLTSIPVCDVCDCRKCFALSTKSRRVKFSSVQCSYRNTSTLDVFTHIQTYVQLSKVSADQRESVLLIISKAFDSSSYTCSSVVSAKYRQGGRQCFGGISSLRLLLLLIRRLKRRHKVFSFLE